MVTLGAVTSLVELLMLGQWIYISIGIGIITMKIKIEIELDTVRDAEEVQSLMDLVEAIRQKDEDEE